jgi:DNA-binding NarL/FixJ family response regulator
MTLLTTDPETSGDARRSGEDVITLFVVDDHDVVREGLAAILDREPDIEIVGHAESAEEALAILPMRDPAVVLIDHRLPGMDGVALCRTIADSTMRAEIVLLSATLDPDVVDAALAAGARAFVVKDVEATELKRAIRAAAHGQTLVDPKVVGRTPAGRWTGSADALFPPSQLRVLRLLVEGLTAAQIAEATGLSPHTIKSYLRMIYRKLGVSSRAAATSAAIRRGLV